MQDGFRSGAQAAAPRSCGNRRFTGSPIDALVCLAVWRGVGRPIPVGYPVWLTISTLAHLRVTFAPQRWPACRGDVRRLRISPDVFEYLPDVSSVRSERDRRGHQRGDAVYQIQRCEGQLVCLGATLVAGGLAARLGAASPPGLHPLCEGAPSKTVGGRNSAAAAAGQRGHALQCKRWYPLRSRCGGKRALLWPRLEHIGVDSEPPRIKPARGPPLWHAWDAQGGEGMEPVPDWDEAAQPARGFKVDQRVSR